MDKDSNNCFCINAQLAIGRHCAVTLAGIKPASLFRVKNQNMKEFLRVMHCFKSRGINFTVLNASKIDCLVIVYDIKSLGALLNITENKRFLADRGYEYSGLNAALSQLKRRVNSDSFPHEIGIFLGYPLEDVNAFIKNPKAAALCGTWKSYGDEKNARQIFDRHRRCTQNICGKIQKGIPLNKIFNVL